MTKTMIATYEQTADADRGVRRLLEEGFTDRQISMLVSDATKSKQLAFESHTRASEGALGGAAAGGALGAIAAGLTAVAGLVIPGVGVTIAGPLVAALVGLGAGGTVGGVVGALIGLGFTETEAKFVEDALKQGSVVLAVSDDDATRMKVAHGVFESTQAKTISRA